VQGFEVVKAVHIETELWTAENEMLTPTLKKKRAPLRDRYIKQINEMYAQLEKSKTSKL
jgi:long-chain acyl-CoA synthetase